MTKTILALTVLGYLCRGGNECRLNLLLGL